ncbi:LCP family protein [Bacillus smithii]|uniref:LCP family glycopolymer transferase n=1 Tax=Bacillus smithii TaxID=1479 RepID=UPI0022E71174|nr:LCP family protein [Bacillus smithii]
MLKKLLKILSIIVVLIVLGGGGYAYYLYHSAKEAADKMHQNIPFDNGRGQSDKTKKSEPISILLMGVDERKNDRGRSDTLIVMTLNPQKEKMQMVSIPRDTRTKIVGKGTMDKINHAYAFGGTKMAINTVEQFTGIPIDYFIRINMEALSGLVDAVGGITVDNHLDWYDEGYYKKGYHYKKGKIELDGPKALGYVRMRHLDPNGDFGRNQRERQVITAILHKATSISSVTHYQDILNTLGNNVKTNLTFQDMMNIRANYRSCLSNIENYEIKGTGQKINGIYYLIVPDEEKAKVTHMLKENLQSE